MFKTVFCTPGNEKILKEFLKENLKPLKLYRPNLLKTIFMKKENI